MKAAERLTTAIIAAIDASAEVEKSAKITPSVWYTREVPVATTALSKLRAAREELTLASMAFAESVRKLECATGGARLKG